MMSAALPWIGMLTASRSDAARLWKSRLLQLRHQPPPPEHRLHDARRARLFERAIDERADAREAGEVGVDEFLRGLLA